MTLVVVILKNRISSRGLVTDVLLFHVSIQFPNKVCTFKWVMDIHLPGRNAQEFWDCSQYVADNAPQPAQKILSSSIYVMLVAAVRQSHGVACVKMQWSIG